MGVKNWERAATRYFAEGRPGFTPRTTTVVEPETLDDFVSSHAGKIARRLLKAADIGIIVVNRKRPNAKFMCVFLDGKGLFRAETYFGDRIFTRSAFENVPVSPADAREVEESFLSPPYGGLVRMIRETLEEIATDAP